MWSLILGCSSIKKGWCGFRYGNHWYRYRERGKRRYPAGRQLRIDCEGSQVGSQRVRLDRQVSPVSTHCYCSLHYNSDCRSLHNFSMLFSVIRLSTNVSLWNIVLLCSGLAAEGNTNVVGKPPYGYPRPRHRFANRCVAETQAIWSQKVSNFEDNDKVHHRTHYLSAYRPVSLAFPRCVDCCCNKIQWPLVTILKY